MLRGHLIVLSAALILASVDAGAQTPNPTTIKVDVDLVLLTTTVTDAQGRMVSGLEKEQFRLWEDKVEQRLDYFSAEQVPLSTAIVFDVSGSMEKKISVARAAVATYLRNGSTVDEYFLVEFSDRPEVTVDYTNDVSRLQNRLIATATKGSTSLLDAIYLAIDKLNQANNARKAILLITDGEENHSRYSPQNVRDALKESDIQMFAIGITGEPDEPRLSASPSQFSAEQRPHRFGSWETRAMKVSATFIPGQELLENLVNITGGHAYFPELVELDAVCSKIAIELKNQYVLGYVSSNSSKDGKWRKVKVKIIPPQGISDLNLRTKPGYYASERAP